MPTPPPLTDQGRATRQRIVGTAAQLMRERGPDGTGLLDVMAATGASKSQLYHYFGDKQGLVHAVVDHMVSGIVGRQAEELASVHTWDDLRRWADWVVAGTEARQSRGGCPVGTLAAALADTDEPARERLAAGLQRWGDAIGQALTQLRDAGLLAPDADLHALTVTTLATLQGGFLLAKTTRDARTLRVALDGAIDYLRSKSNLSR